MEYNVVWYDGGALDVPTNAPVVSTSKSAKSRAPKYINLGAGFDCETSRAYYMNKPQTQDKTSWNAYRESLYSYVYIWQFAVGNTVYLCRDYNMFKSFITALDTALDAYGDGRKIIVWVANINYEFTYFEHLLLDNIHDVFAKSEHDVCSFEWGNHLCFRECLGVFGFNLANIADLHCTTKKMKGDLDYTIPRHKLTNLTKKELQYCINDVAILSELTVHAHEAYTLQGKKIPLTATGIVRDEIKRAYIKKSYNKLKELEKKNADLIGNEIEYSTFRKLLYSGGLTHSNFKYVGQVLHDVTCQDLTSAYPWALNAFWYPAGKLKHCENYPKETLMKYLQGNRTKAKHIIAKIRINNLYSKSTHSTISSHKVITSTNAVLDNGRIFKADSVTLWVSEVDLENICKIYKATSWALLDLYYFTESKRVDKEMLATMNAWYIKKAILKEDMKSMDKHSDEYKACKKEYDELKKKINSVYGMTVTELYKYEYVLNADGNIKANELSWNEYNKTIFNPYIGYWCTAYVRRRLIDVISKFPDSVVQYDTDSIYHIPDKALEKYIEQVNKEVADNIKASPCCTDVHTHDLGAWDFDGFYSEYIPMGSKRYAGIKPDGTVKITFAGAPIEQLKEAVIKAGNNLKTLLHIAITDDVSTKKSAWNCYNTEHANTYTDYTGISYTMITYGCKTIINTDFNASLSHSYASMQKLYCH